MSVLVTGGAGYIGSHTIVELCENGFTPIIVDNFSNSCKESIKRVEKIVGKKIAFYEADVCDKKAMQNIFKANPDISSVIHFAGYKAVGESVANPLMYYSNNIYSTITLLQVMEEFGVKNLVFSSSATVYGMPEKCPLTEDSSLSALNPYGNTKLVIEDILRDLYKATPSINVALLRYFNPVGAHSSYTIGEDPKGIPNNLMPFITQTAVGKREKLSIFGNDYPTHDGTCVRDYIHVVDLAKGHILALKKLATNCGLVTYNLGTGNGYSVTQIVQAFIKATGVELKYEYTTRRPGDAPECYASTDKAKKELGFVAEKTLEDMCRDHYQWQKQNPNGYTK